MGESRHLRAAAVLAGLALAGCSSGGGSSGDDGAGGSSSSGTETSASGSSKPNGAAACAAEYLPNQSAECGVGEADCGSIQSCTSDFDCLACVDRCTPPSCQLDSDCQNSYGDLCDGVHWVCEQYIDELKCTVADGDSSSAASSPSAAATTGSGGGCPGDFPVDCNDGTCCPSDYPYCCSDGCYNAPDCGVGSCPPEAPVLCPGGETCCPNDFPTCCPDSCIIGAVCGTICGSDLTTDDPTLDACYANACCQQFLDCTAYGTSSAPCLDCLENGGGALCDDLAACMNASGCE